MNSSQEIGSAFASGSESGKAIRNLPPASGVSLAGQQPRCSALRRISKSSVVIFGFLGMIPPPSRLGEGLGKVARGGRHLLRRATARAGCPATGPPLSLG